MIYALFSFFFLFFLFFLQLNNAIRNEDMLHRNKQQMVALVHGVTSGSLLQLFRDLKNKSLKCLPSQARATLIWVELIKYRHGTN